MLLLEFPLTCYCLLRTTWETERELMARTCRGLYEVLDPYLYRHNARQSRSSALLWAADHRQEATARKALEAGASPQVRRGHIPFSAALMYGVDIEFHDKYGNTPLTMAARMGREEMVELLLEHGADVNSTSGDEKPLIEAASRGRESIVRLLLA